MTCVERLKVALHAYSGARPGGVSSPSAGGRGV